MRFKWALKSILFSLFLFPSAVHAGECATRAGESGLLACADFDTLTQCTTGREDGCWTDNGLTTGNKGTATSFYIQSCAGAVGSGCVKGKPIYGSTGPGDSDIDITDVTKVNYRFYVKFTDSWVTYDQTHGPGIKGTGTSCIVGGTTELSQFNYFSYHANTCISSFNLNPNQASKPNLKNERWYRIEIQQVLDTNGTDGQYRMWIDGTKVTEYTNVNWGGSSSSALFTSLWGPRAYFHAGIPPWGGEIHFDNMIASSAIAAGSQIGAASGENADLGTADTSSPYFIYTGGEPFLEQTTNSETVRHFATDCSQPDGYKKIRNAIQWGSASTIETTQNKGGVTDSCSNSPAVDDGSLYTTITSSNTRKGFYFARPTGGTTSTLFSQWVIGGYIYLPSGNSYTTAPPLAGWKDYANSIPNGCPDLDYSNYVALTVLSNGNWGIAKRYCPTSGTQSTIDSGVAATFDSWIRFELFLKDSDDSISLAIGTSDSNMSWIIDGTAVGVNIDDQFNASPSGNNGPVVGVLDFQGTPNFNVYYDNVYASSMSFWDCAKGWNAASCPFATPSVNANTPPAAVSLFDRLRRR